MTHRSTLRALVALCLSLGPLADAAQAATPNAPELAARARSEFLDCWRAYERYAFGHDELKPLSRKPHDWHDVSLCITPVDALDTMLLMGIQDEADSVRTLLAQQLSFDHDIVVKNFEITIRVLGGLLSGYQMTQDERLLRLAEELGTRLLPVFDSPTGMPYMFVNLRTGAVSGAQSNPAEIGTLLLEFGTLSKLVRNPVFYDRAKRALVALYERRSKLGLVGEQIDVETGEWLSFASHVGGGIDSYYEYLVKAARLFDDQDCARMARESLRALEAHLADRAPSGLWYGQVDMTSGKRTAPEFGALHAFLPGVLALAGNVDGARSLQESCLTMWNLHGIEPEVLDYRDMRVVHGGYPLRPEIIESAYVLYRKTADPRYLEMGRTFFDGLMKDCRTDSGYTTLVDVIAKRQGDLMPSYFLAETLKYLYLLFAPAEVLDFDAVTFTTEAHPLRRSW